MRSAEEIAEDIFELYEWLKERRTYCQEMEAKARDMHDSLQLRFSGMAFAYDTAIEHMLADYPEYWEMDA